MSLDVIHEFAREAVGLGAIEDSVFLAGDGRLVGIAEPGRRFDKRLQHRLQIESRAADDLEHVGGGGLLLQRFTQLAKQPRILDGDDGLGGKVLHQLDLLVGERTYLLPVDEDSADQLVFLKHRNGDNGAGAS